MTPKDQKENNSHKLTLKLILNKDEKYIRYATVRVVFIFDYTGR